jgi:serine phosphatase RsbU (regulator of sigma subunit)
LERTGGEKYATIFYCLLTADGALSYVNAGHCAPLVVGRTGQCRTLETTAMPVGLMADAQFAVATDRLAPGDLVVIYSDGISEAQNLAGDFFGKKRLREAVTSHAGQGCQGVHDALQDAVTAFTEGAPQSDDITVLVLEFAAAS